MSPQERFYDSDAEMLAFFAAARAEGATRPKPTAEDNQVGADITDAMWALQAETLRPTRHERENHHFDPTCRGCVSDD